MEDVDVGEPTPRKVLSGLVGFLTEADLLDRRVVVVCNLPGREMKGVFSSGLILVATDASGKKVPLLPPAGAAVGSRITFASFPGEPVPAGNPTKRVWEKVSKVRRRVRSRLLTLAAVGDGRQRRCQVQ